VSGVERVTGAVEGVARRTLPIALFEERISALVEGDGRMGVTFGETERVVDRSDDADGMRPAPRIDPDEVTARLPAATAAVDPTLRVRATSPVLADCSIRPLTTAS
jgi:hypothetical protein